MGSSPVQLTAGQVVATEQWQFTLSLNALPNGKRVQLFVVPLRQNAATESWHRVQLSLKFAGLSFECIFCNGFQSWSESREFWPTEVIKPLRSIAKPLMYYYGDTHFEHIKRGKNWLHSWTYTYFRKAPNQLLLIGSNQEANAFTLFQHDLAHQQVLVERDFEGWTFEQATPIFDLFIAEGADRPIFQQWFEQMAIPAPKAPPMSGWTSWYNYYTDISEALLQKHIEGFAARDFPIQIFQIDDGYQTRVGDWFSIKDSFPNGMRSIAEAIHAKGYKAGLWLAPFVCERRSQLYQAHPDWLLRDAKGRPVRAGYAPIWSGYFYALDFYHPEVQAYLAEVLHTFVQTWDFDLLKLDFLYAVCLLPRPDKTRAQILHEALHFIREAVGQETLLLGCGVPLGPSFGLFDYCRIGADIHLKWEHRLLTFLRNRERVSTILSLRSALGRWHLSGLAFQNDPDVFILRQANHQLTPTQQNTILQVNALTGHLLFCSDAMEEYTNSQEQTYYQGHAHLHAQVQQVEQLSLDVYLIEVQTDGGVQRVLANLSGEGFEYQGSYIPAYAVEIIK
ncbi:MAG: glycoside hydrolase family 36 protein [Bacteroidota bacterium]